MEAVRSISVVAVAILTFLAGSVAQAGAPASSAAEALKAEILNLHPLVEEALVWRQAARDFFFELKKSGKVDLLERPELDRIYAGAEIYIELRSRILPVAHKNEWMLDPLGKFTFKPGEGTKIGLKNYHILKDRSKIQLDPSDAEGRRVMQELKLSLSAALVLYDNYLYGIYPYQRNDKMRYLLNNDNKEISGKLDKINLHFADISLRKKVARAIRIFQEELEWRKAAGYVPSAEESSLDEIILQSPGYNWLSRSRRSSSKAAISSLTAFEAQVEDDLKFFNRAFLFVTSKFFGNAMGLVEFREGKLKDMSAANREEIERTLQPLDVLLEKTPFRLTDKFIPGHWGHVAIWSGNEAQLRALGLWDDDLIKPYQEAIRNGARIIEALRPGVQINTLDHFLNIDDFLVLRRTELSDAKRNEYVLRSFAQLGKSYDFNFDVETAHRIVCSELAYVVFPDINWPTDKTLGRYTISPDNVAVKALPKESSGMTELFPVMIYHDGDRVTGDLTRALELLLGEKYDQFAREFRSSHKTEKGIQ